MDVAPRTSFQDVRSSSIFILVAMCSALFTVSCLLSFICRGVSMLTFDRTLLSMESYAHPQKEPFLINWKLQKNNIIGPRSFPFYHTCYSIMEWTRMKVFKKRKKGLQCLWGTRLTRLYSPKMDVYPTGQLRWLAAGWSTYVFISQNKSIHPPFKWNWCLFRRLHICSPCRLLLWQISVA